MRAVHAAVDPVVASELATEWTRLGLSRVPLEIIDCPDRRIQRTLAETVAEETHAGDTEVTVLVPQRQYRRSWHQLLHDSTSKRIVDALSTLPHANVTIVPYQLGSRRVPPRQPAHGHGHGHAADHGTAEGTDEVSTSSARSAE